MNPATPKTAAAFRKRAAVASSSNNTTIALLSKAKNKSVGQGAKSAYRKCICGKLEKNCHDPNCTVKRTLNRVDENAAIKRREERRLAKQKVKRREKRDIQKLIEENGHELDENDESSDSSSASDHSDYEETNEIPERELDRISKQNQQLKKASRQDRETQNKHWKCGICGHLVTNHVLISCPSCFRPRGAVRICYATTVEGVAKTAFEKRRRKQRKQGQNPDTHSACKKPTSDGKLSSLQLGGLNRKQRRAARIKARSKADKLNKKPKKEIIHTIPTKEELERQEQKQKKNARENLFLADKKAAGLNPIKKVKASFRAFFRRKLDDAGTFSKGLQVLFGDDYTRDLQGIQRRPTCHFLPRITELRGLQGLAKQDGNGGGSSSDGGGGGGGGGGDDQKEI